MESGNNGGWEKYQKLVLAELDRLNRTIECFDRKQDCMREDIAQLKVKAGAWGALGGLLAVALAIGVWAVRSLGN